MSPEKRQTLKLGSWEFGRGYPEEDMLAHIYRSGVKNRRNRQDDSAITIDKSEENMNETEIFMAQLSQQLGCDNNQTKNKS